MVTKTIKKVASKKTIPKKTVRKKVTVPKKSAKKATKMSTENKGGFKAMVCAVDGECFWTRDGRILQNLQDLHIAFGSMDDEIFLHHANTEKNDFADWVQYVLQDLDVAVGLRKAKKRTQAEELLASHLENYNI